MHVYSCMCACARMRAKVSALLQDKINEKEAIASGSAPSTLVCEAS
jgi:hypothetical protein